MYATYAIYNSTLCALITDKLVIMYLKKIVCYKKMYRITSNIIKTILHFSNISQISKKILHAIK